jgi:hypothetical protein
MQFLVGILCFVLSSPAWSFTTITTQVFKLDQGRKIDEETLIYLASGLIAKLDFADKENLEYFQQAYANKAWLNIKLDHHRRVIAIAAAPATFEQPKLDTMKGLVDYRPTLINSPDTAQRIFKQARYNPKESQCHNRAHVWAYEWRANHNLFTSKAWIFFTRKYIRKYDFEWWFHVSPYFHILDGGKVWERVADVKFARTPIKLKQWTDIFMRNNAHCPVVSKYSEQAKHPESGWCFIIKSSMYYYRPLDLERLEKDGTQRNVWHPLEVRQAYKEAFDIEL